MNWSRERGLQSGICCDRALLQFSFIRWACSDEAIKIS
jgi:hypothetical protein